MIAIIDYGAGNLHSVAKAFMHLGGEVCVTRDPKVITAADKVVLPGVGAFGDCRRNLDHYQLVDVIGDVIAREIPFLGICVGMQLLFDESEEDPGVPGLGIFAGKIRRLQAPGLKIPHMGWNSLDFAQPSKLFDGTPSGAFVYFVHSYYAIPDDPSLITATANYGQPVTAAVGRGHVQAVQFHPEKSSSVGLEILRQFIR